MRHILGVALLLKACDVTNSGRHMHLVLPRIRNQVKTARNVIFLCFIGKIAHKQALTVSNKSLASGTGS